MVAVERALLERLASGMHWHSVNAPEARTHMSHPHRLLRPLTAGSARIGVFGVLAAAAGLVACSSPGTQAPTVSAASNPAMVTIDMRDASNNHIGSCTGTLVSDSVVLTAGHCVVAMGRAVITTADGQTAGASQVWTTWHNFQSSLSHPLHSDVGVILLDQRINESSFPSLSSSEAPDGQTLARLRRADGQAVTAGNYEQVTEATHVGDPMGFPLAYTMDAAGFEGETDTGGALVDPGSNTIYGVVSGIGTTTGKVYVSRVDYLAGWVASIATCTPPPIQTQCHTSSSGSSGGSNSSGSSGSSGGSGSSSGSQSSSSSSSGGSSSSGAGSGSGSGGWSSSGAGSSSSGSGGWSSSGGGGGDGGPCTPPPPPPPPTGGDDGGTSSGSSGGGSGSSSGAVFGGSSSGGSSGGVFGGSSSGGSSGGNASSSSSGAGSSSGGTPRMPSPGYPLVPDGPGCYDDTCGGCTNDPSCQDGEQDYGNCGCEPGGGYEAGPTQ